MGEKSLHIGVIRQAFGMPLDTQRKALPLDDKAFHQSIWGKCDGFEPLTDLSDPLMVQAVHRDFVGLEDLMQQTARGQADGVGVLIAWVTREPIVFEGAIQLVFDVGIQIAAKSDVEDLDTAADCQDGQVPLEGQL